MHLLSYIVIPYGAYGESVNNKMFKSSYLRAVRILDKMNLQHELQSVLTVAFREDTYFFICLRNGRQFFPKTTTSISVYDFYHRRWRIQHGV